MCSQTWAHWTLYQEVLWNVHLEKTNDLKNLRNLCYFLHICSLKINFCTMFCALALRFMLCIWRKKVFSKLMQEFHRNKNMHIIMFISCGLIVWSLVKKSKWHKMYMIIKKNTHCNTCISISHTTFVIFYSYTDEVLPVSDLDCRILWGRERWETATRLCPLRLGGGRSMPKRLSWGTCHPWSFRVVWLKMIYKISKDFICQE